MTEAKHTALTVVAEAAANLRSVHYRMDCKAHPERAAALLAGAALVEAAPDMLAELRRLYEIHGYQSTFDVIAKATGAE